MQLRKKYILEIFYGLIISFILILMFLLVTGKFKGFASVLIIPFFSLLGVLLAVSKFHLIALLPLFIIILAYITVILWPQIKFRFVFSVYFILFIIAGLKCMVVISGGA